MKLSIKHIMICAALTVSLGACQNDILSQKSPSTFDSQMIFSNYSLAQSAFDGIWETLLDGQCYSLRYHCFFGANTDIEITLSDSENNHGIQRYAATPTHARLNSTSESFSLFYQAIERANLILDGLKSYADLENDENMRILYAQTLTMRAHIYYDLTRAWGDVPARFVPVAKDELYKPKVSRDIIFKQVLNDLDEAIPMLPYPGEHSMTVDAYHINKIYAVGLFARFALMASGSALRPEDGKIGTNDPGRVRLSNDPEVAKDKLYPRALAHLEDVIKDNKMTLAPDYKEYWRKFNNGELYVDPVEESVLVIPYSSNGRWAYTHAARINSNTTINGYTVSHTPYTGPAPTLYFDFDPEDKRRNVTCFNCTAKGTKAEAVDISLWYYGKFRIDQMTTHPWTGTNTDTVKPLAMRYSDVLLMAAEIANELGHLSDAKDYLRPVRVRAFNESKADAFLETLTDKDKFFKAIVDERAFEFCGEQIRKTDLIRWGVLKKKMDETKARMYQLREREGEYSWIPEKIYWKVNPSDNWEVIFYGYNPGETGAPAGDGWTSKKFCSYDNSNIDKNYSTMSDVKIESIYKNDPDKRQFWPIQANAITNSQGYLVNDYNY